MSRRGRLGGPGDWLAPLAALLVVTGLAWTGHALILRAGWPLPWSAAREAAPGGEPAPPVQSGHGASAPPVPSPAASPAPAADDEDDVATLRRRRLLVPVEGVDRTALRSGFHEARSGGAHEAIDILAPRGTAVLAVEDGTIAKLFTSERGGLTIYQFDPGDTFAYYYAHLDGYAPGVRDGARVRRGDVLGYVGTSGNAPPATPHLHFSVFKLGQDRRWWEGHAIDPYLVFR